MPDNNILDKPIKLCEICNKQNGLGFMPCISCGNKIWMCVFCAPVCPKCRSLKIAKRPRIKTKHKFTTGRIDNYVK
jgi:hypothetical protein